MSIPNESCTGAKVMEAQSCMDETVTSKSRLRLLVRASPLTAIIPTNKRSSTTKNIYINNFPHHQKKKKGY